MGKRAALLAAAATAALSASVADAAAFTAGAIVVQRVGDGTTALGTTGAAVSLLEMDPATGSTLQTINLAAGAIVTTTTPKTGGCVAGGSLYTESLMSGSADRRYLAIPCYASTVGGTTSATAVRTLVRVGIDGVPDYTTLFTGAASENLRAATSYDGSRYWLATNNGAKTVVHGAQSIAETSVTSTSGFSLRGMVAAMDSVYTVSASGTYGVVKLGFPTATASTALTALQVGTIAQGAAYATLVGVAVPDPATIYVAGVSTTAALAKFTYDTGTAAWAQPATGWPKAPPTFTDPTTATTVTSVTGLRTLVGTTDAATGAYVLYTTTYPAGANYVLRFNTAAETFAYVAKSGAAGYDFRSVALAPYAWSATVTPTATASPSATATASGGSSPSTTATATGTPTPTPTGTPQLCSVDTAPRAMAAAGASVLVVRVGAGVSALGYGFREFYLDELDLTTGARLQSIAVPPSPALGGCVLQQNFTTDGYVARSADGAHAVVGCWGASGPVFALGTGAGVPKVVLRVDAAGSLSPAGSLLNSAATFRSVQAASAADGGRLFAFTSTGVAAATAGAFNATPTALTTGSWRGSTWFSGALYAVYAGAGGVMTLADLTTAGQAVTYALPAAVVDTTTASSLAFRDASTLFIADYANSISRWDNVGGTWTQAYKKLQMNVTYGGAGLVLSGARGMVGVTDPATGRFTLVFTSGLTSAAYPGGGNYVLKFDTVTEEFSVLARACAQTEYRSVALAPVPASPSATPSGTPTASLTPSASASPPSSATPSATFGASASPTSSPTASISVSGSPTASPSVSGSPAATVSASLSPTASRTPSATPTASPSNLCSTPNLAPAPLTPGSVLAVRVGDGRTALSTTSTNGREVYLDELSAETGARLQSIGPLPSGPALSYAADGSLAALPGCVLPAMYPFDGLATRSADGTFVALACHVQAVGAMSGTGVKHVLTLGYDGGLRTGALFTTGATSSVQMRSVATADGAYFWVGTASGVFAVPGGANGTAGTLVSSNSYRGETLWGGGLYAVPTAPSLTSVHMIGGYAGFYSSPPTASPAPLPNGAPGVKAVYGDSPSSVVFADDGLTMYLVDGGVSSANATLLKYTRPSTASSAAWALAPGYPRWGFNSSAGAVLAYGARGATGWTDPATGAFHLLAASGAGLLKYNPATNVAVLLAAPCALTEWRGLALSPVAPSATATLSPTPSATGSGTGSSSGTPSQTGTPSPSGTGTPSPSGTGSQTGTPSPSATASGSGTPSPSRTGTPSPSQTGSPSGASTRTPTGSPTGSPSTTGTPSSSGSGTASQSHTGTPSASGTASGSASPAGTPPPTESMTATMTPTSSGTSTGSSSQTETPSPSATGSPSPSQTASATKTGTGTRSRTAPPSASRTQTGSPSGSRTASPPPTDTRTGTASPSGSRTPTPSPSTTGTPSGTPSLSATPSRSATRTPPVTKTPTRTGTPSSSASKTGTASPSATLTPTPSLVAPAWSEWVAVLRLGDGGASAKAARAGIALPLYVDYYAVPPPGAPAPGGAPRVLSVPLPTTPSDDGKSGACTLATGKDVTNRWNFDTEGFPSNSGDGAFGLIPCYNVPAGQPLAGDAPKTLATLNGEQSVSTRYTGFISSLKREEAGSNDGWRSLASPNGRKFYTASVATYGAGFQYVPDGSKSDADGVLPSVRVFPGSDDSITAGTLDARSVALFGGKLYGLCGPRDGAGFNTVFQIGGGGAPSGGTDAYAPLPGMGALGQAWAFAFADASSVWVSAERGAVKGTVQLYKKMGTNFALAFSVQFSTKQVYNLAGRVEYGSFVLYGTDGAKLLRYDTAGVAAKVNKPVTLATAPADGVFRGVLFPGAPGASPSPSASPSRASKTATASKTPKPSASRSSTKKKKLLRE